MTDWNSEVEQLHGYCLLRSVIMEERGFTYLVSETQATFMQSAKEIGGVHQEIVGLVA